MSIDMYGPKVAEASALIREFAKTEYFHYFAGDPEKALEQFIAMLDQAEEKGRQAKAESAKPASVCHPSALDSLGHRGDAWLDLLVKVEDYHCAVADTNSQDSAEALAAENAVCEYVWGRLQKEAAGKNMAAVCKEQA